MGTNGLQLNNQIEEIYNDETIDLLGENNSKGFIIKFIITEL